MTRAMPSRLGLLGAKIRRVIEQAFAALSRSAASGSRTTALAPLHMVLALCLGATLVAVGGGAPMPVVWLFGVFSALALLLELVAYVYLLFNDRDALRSERYTLEKMRIEKGLLGDTISGFRDASVITPVLPAASDENR